MVRLMLSGVSSWSSSCKRLNDRCSCRSVCLRILNKSASPLERDIEIINGEIKKTQLGIQARTLAIEQLSDQILEKEEILDILAERLKKQQDSLADLVRKSALLEEYTLVEVILSKQSFSEFFTDMAKYQAIKQSLNESLSVLHEIRRDTLEQKNILESKQENRG
jgi:peptidoglycan hydrolase CwlO-like protein